VSCHESCDHLGSRAMDAQTRVDALQSLGEREQIRCLSLFWFHVGREGGDSKEGPLYTVFGVVVVRHLVYLPAVLHNI
jgi:hypothetical protein